MHGMQEVTGSIPVISTKRSTTQKCVVLLLLQTAQQQREFRSAGRADAWAARGHRDLNSPVISTKRSTTQKCVVLLLLQAAQQQRGFRSAGRAGAWAARGHRDLNSPVISTNLKASHRNVWCFCFYRTLSVTVDAVPPPPFQGELLAKRRGLLFNSKKASPDLSG